jgi:hypothetical protein
MGVKNWQSQRTEGTPSDVAGAAAAAPGLRLTQLEAERRALAATLLSNKQRRRYERVLNAVGRSQARVDALAAKARSAAASGDSGVGRTASAAATAPKPAPSPAPTSLKPSTTASGGAKAASSHAKPKTGNKKL